MNKDTEIALMKAEVAALRPSEMHNIDPVVFARRVKSKGSARSVQFLAHVFSMARGDASYRPEGLRPGEF